MTEINHKYLCECGDKLVPITIGHICKKCAKVYDDEGCIWFELTVATYEKIEKLINGGVK